MALTALAADPAPARVPSVPPVIGVRADGSLGVARYADRLAATCRELGVDYVTGAAPLPGRARHFHLANSSRTPLRHALRAREPFVVTVHDVVPRTRALEPAYRLLGPHLFSHAAAVVVHSSFAADLLRRRGIRPRRLEVVHHPAPPLARNRDAARSRLGVDPGGVLFVLPGVLKRAKLVAETIEAARPLVESGAARLLIAGRVADTAAVDTARAAGVDVLANPDDETYADAIAAADAVLILRDRSVGETNGPLLDALGCGRAVLATPTGSVPETAGDAALFCEPAVASIRRGLERLLDAGERHELERMAARRGADLSPAAAAGAHLHLFAEVFRA